MSEIQVCEGIWRNRVRQFVLVRRCEPVGGQQWTDGMYHVHDDGKFIAGRESNPDLLEYIGPLPQQDQTAKIDLLRTTLTEQTAEIDRLRIELQETYAGWSDSNSALADQAAKIELFRTTLTEQTAEIDRLRSENESLTVRLQRAEVAAAEALQRWETTEQVCLRIITALAGVRS